MSKLQPTLWRTCRVLSHPTRLHLLWEIFKNPPTSVTDLAKKTGTTDHNASTQLRALSARGLITPHRIKNKVFYMPEVNTEVAHTQELLNILKNCFEYRMPMETIIQQTTAFTHLRRIELIKVIHTTDQSRDELQRKTGIPVASLLRHLRKLKSRGFIVARNGRYKLAEVTNPLGCCLLRIAQTD